MAARFAAGSQYRSISLPSRLRPVPAGIEEELDKLRAWLEYSPSSLKAERMRAGLEGLASLHESVEALLRLLPLAGRANATRVRAVEEVLDGHVGLLDACDRLRDVVLNIKERAVDVRSALRRRGADRSVVGEHVSGYVRFRKSSKKVVEKLLRELKSAGEEKKSSCHHHHHHLNMLERDDDQAVSMVMGVFGEARAVSISVISRVLCFFVLSHGKTAAAKSSKWSSVVAAADSDGESESELGRVDASMRAIHRRLEGGKGGVDVEAVRVARTRLESLEVGVAGVEAGVVAVYRRLIRTRVTLLNVLSS